MSTQPYDGHATGNMNDGYDINQVVVKAPKQNTALSDLIKVAGITAGYGVVAVMGDKLAQKANDNIKTATDGLSVKGGLDRGTMIFLGLLAVAGLGTWYYQKR